MEFMDKVLVGCLVVFVVSCGFIYFMVNMEGDGVVEEFVPLLASQAEVNEYAGGVFSFDCEGDEFIFQTTDDFPLPVDERGFVGFPMTIAVPDREAAMGGVLVFQLVVDPNSGWVMRQLCNPDYVSECPERIDRSPMENPDYELYNEVESIVGYGAFSECLAITSR